MSKIQNPRSTTLRREVPGPTVQVPGYSNSPSPNLSPQGRGINANTPIPVNSVFSVTSVVQNQSWNVEPGTRIPVLFLSVGIYPLPDKPVCNDVGDLGPIRIPDRQQVGFLIEIYDYLPAAEVVRQLSFFPEQINRVGLG